MRSPIHRFVSLFAASSGPLFDPLSALLWATSGSGRSYPSFCPLSVLIPGSLSSIVLLASSGPIIALFWSFRRRAVEFCSADISLEEALIWILLRVLWEVRCWLCRCPPLVQSSSSSGPLIGMLSAFVPMTSASKRPLSGYPLFPLPSPGLLPQKPIDTL